MTPDEIKQIEKLVNRQILDGKPVTIHTDLPIAEAKARGAMALFGEKYGNEVRCLLVSNHGFEKSGEAFSLELCGGTHVDATGDIGAFKIVSDSSVAAG